MIRQDALHEDSVGTLFHRLIDDGRAYATAEIDVVRATARSKVQLAKTPIILVVGSIFLLQAGLTVLVMGLGSTIGLLVPIWAGQLIAALVAFVVAGLMVKIALDRLLASGSAETDAGTRP